jgi:hypothetical protein
MADACTITRGTGEVVGPGGVITPTTSTQYDGPCKVQQRAVAGNSDESGEATLLIVTREVHLPVLTSTTVKADDQITITAAAVDPALVGKVFVVRGEAGKTYASARRLQVIEVTS